MYLPRVLSTRVDVISRHGPRATNFAASVAYATRGRLRDHLGRPFDYRARGGAIEVQLHGWELRPGETQDDAIQRLVIAVQTRERRADAREGRSFMYALPCGAGEEAARMRSEIVRAVGERWVQDHGVAGVTGVHEPPTPDENWHAHLVTSRRQVLPDLTLGASTAILDSRAGDGWLLELRHEIAAMCNRMEVALGRDPVWTGHGYEEAYGCLNRQRAAEGLELLEVPLAQVHEGARVTGLRRKLQRLGCALPPGIAEFNEFARQHNEGIRERNEARIARDGLIRELRPRVAAWSEAKSLARELRDQTDPRASRLQELLHAAGEWLDLARKLERLPPAARALVSDDARTVDAILKSLRDGRRGPVLGFGQSRSVSAGAP